jgi:hypothetical protein
MLPLVGLIYHRWNDYLNVGGFSPLKHLIHECVTTIIKKGSETPENEEYPKTLSIFDRVSDSNQTRIF